MTPRLAPVLILAASLALCWTLAGHVARAGSAGRVVAANSPGMLESSANYSKSSNSWPDAFAGLPEAWDGHIGLPFAAGEGWTRTQGPHTAMYAGSPDVAVDFAPPDSPPCPGAPPSPHPVRAALPGVVDDTGPGYVSLRVARDGTAVLLYHVEDAGKVAVGTRVEAGAALGYVGCTYGMTTGPHVHIAMARAGEWLSAPEEWIGGE